MGFNMGGERKGVGTVFPRWFETGEITYYPGHFVPAPPPPPLLHHPTTIKWNVEGVDLGRKYVYCTNAYACVLYKSLHMYMENRIKKLLFVLNVNHKLIGNHLTRLSVST